MAHDPSSLAARLADARATARPIAVEAGEVASVAGAYAVQAELIRLSGDEVGGWKVSALTPEDQRTLGMARAVAGALLAAHVHRAPARLALSAFVAPAIECEIAFVLGADLPERLRPYSREEVEAAVAAVVPVFEIADSRISAGATDFTKIADAVNNGSLVTGVPVESWRDLDLAALAITLTRDDDTIAAGTGARILGDPVLALLALANAQPLPAPLRAGQIVTTGTCTGMLPVGPGEYVGDFAALGSVAVSFTA